MRAVQLTIPVVAHEGIELDPPGGQPELDASNSRLSGR